MFWVASNDHNKKNNIYDTSVIHVLEEVPELQRPAQSRGRQGNEFFPVFSF